MNNLYYLIFYYKDGEGRGQDWKRLSNKSYKAIGTARTAAKAKLRADYVSSALYKVDIVKRQEGFRVSHSIEAS